MRELILCQGLTEDSAEAVRLRCYLALLEKWNARINLTAATEWSAVGRLFGEALWAARFYPGTTGRHLDIGSGAGFPAIPMKIMIPGMRLDLVESRARRAAFLETVAAELRLENVRVFCRRIEEHLGDPEVPAYDTVSWKGLKLSRGAWKLLRERSLAATQLWLFHGARLPLADPRAAAGHLGLVARRPTPGHAGHYLSIYHVSRETSST